MRILCKDQSMPKMKSVKGAVKRFKVKKNGSLKRGTAFRSHILTKQDAQTRRKQNAPKVVAKVDEKKVKAMIS
jgi:large subunit ribosomal protein L35